MAYPFSAGNQNGAGVTPYPFMATPNIGLKVAPIVAANYRPMVAPMSPTTRKSTAMANGGTGDPLWLEALHTLGGIGKMVTQQTANWTDGKLDWNDMPIVAQKNMMATTGWNGQKAAWGDKTFSLADVPVLGMLSSMGRDLSGFDQTLKNRGVTNEKALFWGGLAGDIILDPTNLVTFGAGSAIKAGSKAMQVTAKELGKEFGVKVAANTGYKKVAETLATKTYDDAIAKGAAHEVAQKASDMARDFATKRLEDAGKTGRYKAQNALGSIDVPFTNITYQFGKKPAILAKSSAKLKEAGAKSLTGVLNRAGLVGAQGTEFVEKALGKTKLEDVTYQEFLYLKKEATKYAEHAKKNPIVSPWTHSADGVPVPTVDPLSSFKADAFVPDMGGMSPLGQKLADKVKAFNPRGIGTEASGGIVRAMGDAIQNATGAVRGAERMAKLARTELDQIVGRGELTPIEAKAIENILEGVPVPKHYATTGLDEFNPDKVEKGAAFLKDRYAKMAEAEGAAGVLDSTRKGYAPHIPTHSPEKFAEIMAKYGDDPELQQLGKVSSVNKANQARTGFQTFADLDNYLVELNKKVFAETDSVKRAALAQKYDDIEGLFERDPFKAFEKRTLASFKAEQYGNLYKTMEEDGLILSGAQAKNFDPNVFEQLDAKTAKRLNVSPGSIMNKEVKAALLEIEKVFTSEGLNKFADNATAVTNIWKSLVTVVRPVHHVNNIIGNLFNSSMAGVQPKAYKDAASTLIRMMRGKPKQEDINIMRDAIQSGIFGQSHSNEFRRLFDGQNASTLRKTERMIVDNAYTSFMRRWVGDTTDNWSRLAMFISAKGKTGSSQVASDTVRKYLFNYGEQTSADRLTRLVVPFWMWTKNNIPLQLEKMLQQPRFASTYANLQDASYEAHGNKRTDQADFISEGYFQTPWGTLRNPRAPVADLNNLGSLDKTLSFGASSLNPLLRVPLEMAANKQFFSGRAIDAGFDRTGQRDPAAWGKYGMSQVSPVNDIYNLFSGKTDIWDTLFGRELDMQ